MFSSTNHLVAISQGVKKNFSEATKMIIISKNSFGFMYISNLSLNFSTRINELRNLQYLPRLSEARETMIEDRTKAHADHVGHGHERITTAAVGEP